MKSESTIIFPSLNKSDSEDSIVSSQTTTARQTKANKTRSRIEQKLLATTQKPSKASKFKEPTPKVTCTAAPKLLKQNSQPMFEDSSDDDEDDSTESGLMFDSDDTGKSQAKSKKVSGSLNVRIGRGKEVKKKTEVEVKYGRKGMEKGDKKITGKSSYTNYVDVNRKRKVTVDRMNEYNKSKRLKI